MISLKLVKIRRSHSANRTERNDDAIFSQIVSECSQRIKERIRLVVARNEREPLKKLLQRIIKSLKKPAPGFSEKAQTLIHALDAWSGHQTDARLKEVVQRVFELGQLEGLQQLIDNIPNRDIAPSSRTNLLNIVGKVSRYREAARVLYRMAKKFPIARRYKIIAISLPEDSFRRPPTTVPSTPPPTLASVLTRIRGGSSQSARRKGRKTMTQIYRILEKSEQEVNEKFISYRTQTLQEAKIHAEVQLAHHYDTQHVHPRPRVICSSKNACYLCNVFILLHGKLRTPKCHGRLYFGWRTQAVTEASLGMDVLVKRLENQVLESIELMMERRQKIYYPDPNESTLLTIPHSFSTEEDSGSSETIRPPEGQSSLSRRHGSSISLRHAQQAEATETIPQIDTAVMVEPVGEKDPATGDDAVDEIISLRPEGLVQDQTVTCELQANDAPQRYYAWPLNLEVEYTVGPGGPLGGGSSDVARVKYSLTWLSDQDKAEIGQSKDAKIIEGDTIKDQIQLDPQDLRNLYISVGKTVLKFEEVQ